ncbi:hypothetical protein [Priestia megaterium]|uniref:hypothetical protein n=1 Tax=Priestia megaterium TaxID=1404 RepID=UPI003879A785
MNKIGDLVKREILNPTIDIGADYSNIAIDSITDKEILGEIPFVKTIVAGTNIALAIKERHFVKKLVNFLTELHSGEIDQKKFDKFKEKLELNPTFQEKVTETITVMVDRHIAVEQSKVLANLLRSHINGNIDWTRFNTLCILLDRLHPEAYKTLNNMALGTNENLSYSYHTTIMNSHQGENYFNHEEEAFLLSSGLITTYGTSYRVTPLGKDLFKYGILPLFR